MNTEQGFTIRYIVRYVDSYASTAMLAGGAYLLWGWMGLGICLFVVGIIALFGTGAEHRKEWQARGQ